MYHYPHVDTVSYKGFDIKIFKDVGAMSPIDENESFPFLYAVREGEISISPDAKMNLFDIISISRDELKKNVGAVIALINEYDETSHSSLLSLLRSAYSFAGHEDALDLTNHLIEHVFEHNTDYTLELGSPTCRLTFLSRLLAIKGINHKLATVKGYVQGDIITVLAIEKEGCTDLGDAIDIYAHWLLGNVYSYSCFDSGECLAYGSDMYGNSGEWEKMGVLGNAKEEIDSNVSISHGLDKTIGVSEVTEKLSYVLEQEDHLGNIQILGVLDSPNLSDQHLEKIYSDFKLIDTQPVTGGRIKWKKTVKVGKDIHMLYLYEFAMNKLKSMGV
jgi:hypothetical protein